MINALALNMTRLKPSFPIFIKTLLTLNLLSVTLLMAQNLNSTLTQRGGEQNTLFVNPASLANLAVDKSIKINLINSSVILDNQSFKFLKELNGLDNNQEVSKLLKKNIGEILSFSANNFSSIYQNQDHMAWSLGIVNSFDGYFITHSGFGSKRALESFVENYRALMGTVVVKQENIDYGLTLKLIEKSQTIYNYAINEIANRSISDYFDNEHTQKENSSDLDMGIIYHLPKNSLKTKLSLAFTDIRDDVKTNIGFSIEPFDTLIKVNYLQNNLRADISKSFFNKSLELHSGVIYNALSYGVNYHLSLFNIGFHSYRVKEIYNQQKERKYELSVGILW